MASKVTSRPNDGLHEVSSSEEVSESWALPEATGTPTPYRHRIVWRQIIIMSTLRAGGLYGAYLVLTSAKVITTIYALIMYQLACLGITAGAHRLWCHRAYQAKWPTRVFLMLLQTLAFQGHIYRWVRDHRMHHKYCDTDADPHNSRRGFFFSHIGWLLVHKHPELRKKGLELDFSDLKADPIVRFQKKFYFTLMPIVYFIIPTAIPMYFWGESFLNAWFVATMFRIAATLNSISLVNSVTHYSVGWGTKPYDRYMGTTENLGVSILATGAGWHNYHHVFPWDYKAAELGNYRANLALIDIFAYLGQAYDLKTVPASIVEKRVKRTGDGSHTVWGCGEKDISQETIENVVNEKQK